MQKIPLLSRASLTVSALMLSVASFAQSTTTSGIVKDAAGDPLIGVNVYVKGSKQMAVTDLDGKFTLKEVPYSSRISDMRRRSRRPRQT